MEHISSALKSSYSYLFPNEPLSETDTKTDTTCKSMFQRMKDEFHARPLLTSAIVIGTALVALALTGTLATPPGWIITAAVVTVVAGALLYRHMQSFTLSPGELDKAADSFENEPLKKDNTDKRYYAMVQAAHAIKYTNKTIKEAIYCIKDYSFHEYELKELEAFHDRLVDCKENPLIRSLKNKIDALKDLLNKYPDAEPQSISKIRKQLEDLKLFLKKLTEEKKLPLEAFLETIKTQHFEKTKECNEIQKLFNKFRSEITFQVTLKSNGEEKKSSTKEKKEATLTIPNEPTLETLKNNIKLAMDRGLLLTINSKHITEENLSELDIIPIHVLWIIEQNALLPTNMAFEKLSTSLITLKQDEGKPRIIKLKDSETSWDAEMEFYLQYNTIDFIHEDPIQLGKSKGECTFSIPKDQTDNQKIELKIKITPEGT